MDTQGAGRTGPTTLTAQEEEELRQLSARPDIYDLVAKSIAPSIFGSGGMLYRTSKMV